MHERLPSKDSSTFLAIAPAPPAARRCASAIAAALLAIFFTFIPFVKVPLPEIDVFIPIFDSTMALSNLITAGFLFVGFSRSRLRAVLGLAGGYIFSGFTAVGHLLISSGLFAGSGLLVSGPETGAWLDIFRNAGFPLFVICYVLLKQDENTAAQLRPSTRICIVSVTASAIAGTCMLFFLASAGHSLLPRIVNGDGYTAAMVSANAATLLFGLIALMVLGFRFPYSILDLWLLVIICAWMCGVVLSTIINSGRFDSGFAIGHLYGVLAAGIAPLVIIFEAARVTRHLDEAIAVAEERNAQLAASREQLAQAQRLEAIGQLTGGVAHDFNNLLTVIIANLELIQQTHGDRKKIERLVQAAMKAAQRGEHLVGQLLTYARKQVNRPQVVNLNQLIANVVGLMHRVIGEQIYVVPILSPVLAPVHIDPMQFETAILNLALNSRDAMAGGGQIMIETANALVDQHHAATDPEVSPGRYVVITVTDSGAGMTPDVLARAFDPFFTTKEVGRGSGLGLSQVYGFVKTAGGHVKIDSQPGVGTTVTLYLPQSGDRNLLSPAEAETASLPRSSRGGTILVVEDDEAVRTVTTESLTELGYLVVTAGSAAQALEIIESCQPIDLLFSDVIIAGGMNGAELAMRARHIRKDLKVLLTSGYTAAALCLDHGLPENLEVVAKPYRREELANKLSLVIGV
jgi:signal transduction histidine kinase/CheY-like chemotaxis protein